MVNQQVSIILVDFKIPSSTGQGIDSTKCHDLMRRKFSNQQQGRLLYLERRRKTYSYIPIEFSRDLEFVLGILQNSREDISFTDFLTHIPNQILQNPEIMARLCAIYSANPGYVEKHWNNFVQLFFNRREIVEKSIEWNPLVLRFVSNELRNDFDIVMKAVKIDGYSLVYASDSLRGNREIVKQAVIQHGFNILLACGDLIKDVELQKLAIQNKPTVFQQLVNMIPICEIDHQVIELVVTLHGKSIAFIPHNFDNYRDLLLMAIENDGCALSFAPEAFKSDREIVMVAVSRKGESFFFASSELKQDRQLILKALETSTSFYLSQLPKHLQDDMEIIHSVLKLNPRYIQCFSDKNLDDEYVISIIENMPSLFRFTPQFKKDRNIVMKFLKLDGNNLQYVDSEFRNDPEFILQAARQNIRSIQYAESISNELLDELIDMEGFYPYLVWFNSSFRDDRETIKKMLKINGSLFQLLEESMRMDRELLTIALDTCGSALCYANIELQNDYELFKKSTLISRSWIQLIPRTSTDREFIKLFVSFEGILLRDFPNFQDDMEIVTMAVKQNGQAFNYASTRLHLDEEMQSTVVKESGFCFRPSENLFNSRMEHYYFDSYQPEHYPLYPFNNYEMDFDGLHAKIPDYNQISKLLQL